MTGPENEEGDAIWGKLVLMLSLHLSRFNQKKVNHKILRVFRLYFTRKEEPSVGIELITSFNEN